MWCCGVIACLFLGFGMLSLIGHDGKEGVGWTLAAIATMLIGMSCCGSLNEFSLAIIEPFLRADVPAEAAPSSSIEPPDVPATLLSIDTGDSNADNGAY